MAPIYYHQAKVIICCVIFLSISVFIAELTFTSRDHEALSPLKAKYTSSETTKEEENNESIAKGDTNTEFFLNVYRDLYKSDTNDTLNTVETRGESEAIALSPSLSIPMVIVACNSDGKMNKHSSVDDNKSSWERQVTQIRTMLGTLLLFSKSPMWRIIVITDSWNTFYHILNLTYKWPFQVRKRLRLERYPIDYQVPTNGLMSEWRPCSWTKIFLADLLTDLEFVVYFDTDFVFLGPAEDLWLEINKMNENHVLGVGQEAWYSYEKNRISAGRRGLNTGVLLMNLTRARNVSNKSFSQQILKEIPNVEGPRHDQDVVNSYLEKYNELFMEISPRFNFLPSTCMLNIVCPDCEEKGVVAFHGADGSFFSSVDPRWEVIYGTLSEATIHLTIHYSRLLALLESQLNSFQITKLKGSCSHYSLFNKMILKVLKENQ